MQRKGFTLGEILIVLLLIGILSVLSIQTVKTQQQKFTFTCYHLYRDLKIAVGHMAAQTYGGSLKSFSCDSVAQTANYSQCVADGLAGQSNANLLNYGGANGGQDFCKGLSKVLGTASSINCTTFSGATLASPYGSLGAEGAKVTNSTENFRLINGYLVYVSDKIAQSGTTKGYRVVTFDVNGNKKPNVTGKDIISFAVFDSGEVLPLGTPANDANYFNAVIKVRNILYMGTANKTAAINAMRHPTTLVINRTTKKPYTFKEAYCAAYGQSENYPSYCNGIAVSGNFSTNLPISVCTNKSVKVGSNDYFAECEFTVVKPQVSKFIPISQDAYSSKNNSEDTVTSEDDNGNTYTQSSQIYMY